MTRATPCYRELLTCQSACWGLLHLGFTSKKPYTITPLLGTDYQERALSHRTHVPHQSCCGFGVDSWSLSRGFLALCFPYTVGA